MAKSVHFIFGEKSVEAEIIKVDRRKIYGWTTVDVFDEHGSECVIAGLAEGKYVLPAGSTSQVILNRDGESVARSDLVGVDDKGNTVDLVPSVFEQDVVLTETTVDEYLLCSVKSVYQLVVSHGNDSLLSLLESGTLFRFIFNYRADYEGDDAFLVANEGVIFAVVGKMTEPEFLGIYQTEDDLTDEDSIEADDDIDFAMF